MDDETLLDFFKTLANADRLKIIGLLALEPQTAAGIARRIGSPPAQVLRHLERLQALGLIATTGAAALTLDTRALEALSRQALAGARPAFPAETLEGDAYDRKILKDYLTADGRLKSIPTQEKKLLAVLRHLAQAFNLGERYPEKQVNQIISRYHEDTAALRRSLVDHGLMTRSSGEYWRL